MRTFIAIELSPEAREYLSEIQTETQKYCRRGNYTPQDNFHITLHFLGEIEPSDVEYVKDAMFEAAQRHRVFDLKLGQIGFFGRGERGILWAGLDKSDSLQRLFSVLEKSLERQGFAREKKGLSPHITLGREVEPQRSFSDVQKAVVMEGKSFKVEKITLMESVRRGPRLIYKPIYQQLLKGYQA
ncbi:2'-5'-RNA ligase [Anaerotignum neopropionicum]|uniref:RNA 2',3'-cyclic phosphodiesterase n=1 Tax=Anaerotignum neopropionicum TaxID=36847 RepID=A0A136WCQ5_9FIRM|nr:RNA 2',3'-cyclic phosphodiesterase [Anaerotignum neopropionicum]KXL52298.1 2'-5'-RNA ligase [Anaerotignum neopropionicum]